MKQLKKLFVKNIYIYYIYILYILYIYITSYIIYMYIYILYIMYTYMYYIYYIILRYSKRNVKPFCRQNVFNCCTEYAKVFNVAKFIATKE